MQVPAKSDALPRLLVAVLSACLVVQPLFVPLHLAQEEHTHGLVPAGQAVVAHHGHPNPHLPRAPAGHQAAEHPDGNPHRPHPAEDHLVLEQEQLPAPTDSGPVASPLALAPTALALASDPTTSQPLQPPHRVRARPPPRAAARPRAPPTIA